MATALILVAQQQELQVAAMIRRKWIRNNILATIQDKTLFMHSFILVLYTYM